MNEDGIVLTTDQIDELLDYQQETNDLLTQLVQYNLDKEAAEKEAAEQQAAKEKKELEEQEKQQKEQAKTEKQEQQALKSQQETQEAREVNQEQLIQEIHDYVDLSNYIMVGQICFLGVILGVVLMKIFWDRFHI